MLCKLYLKLIWSLAHLFLFECIFHTTKFLCPLSKKTPCAGYIVYTTIVLTFKAIITNLEGRVPCHAKQWPTTTSSKLCYLELSTVFRYVLHKWLGYKWVEHPWWRTQGCCGLQYMCMSESFGSYSNTNDFTVMSCFIFSCEIICMWCANDCKPYLFWTCGLQLFARTNDCKPCFFILFVECNCLHVWTIASHLIFCFWNCGVQSFVRANHCKSCHT
jgi:hypothetical protein